MVFPEKFLWEASNSGFQFEMGDSAGLNVDSGSDWYLWVHTHALKLDTSNVSSPSHLIAGLGNADVLNIKIPFR